jgi:hypothetical protein
VSNPFQPDDDRAGLSRLRDYLYANGPCTVVEAATACEMSPSTVSGLLREGRIALAGPAGRGTRRCVICQEPAAVNDLCPECHRGFRDARRPAGGSGMRVRA